MNPFFVRAFATLFFFATAAVLHAQAPPLISVPQLINYQGRVAVGGVNFNGGGQFKFALVNSDGTTTYWSNDRTSTAGSEPTSAVPLTVTNGLYSVVLGDDSGLINMASLDAKVFNNADVRLRVWFNDGTHGSQLLAPDQRIVAAPYAIFANAVSNPVPNFQVFNDPNGTFTVPANVTRIMVEVWGGGGGGGGGGNGLGSTTSTPGGNGGGGGGGGYGKDVLTVSPGDNFAVTLGSGGAGGGAGAAGSAGGTSSLGSVNATGGFGGSGGGNAYVSDGNPVWGANGNGGNPGTSMASISINGVQGGGGGGQGNPGGGFLPGGAGAIGGAGGLGSVGGFPGSFQAGQSPGGGGASGSGTTGNGNTGSPGAAGRVIVWW